MEKNMINKTVFILKDKNNHLIGIFMNEKFVKLKILIHKIIHGKNYRGLYMDQIELLFFE